MLQSRRRHRQMPTDCLVSVRCCACAMLLFAMHCVLSSCSRGVGTDGAISRHPAIAINDVAESDYIVGPLGGSWEADGLPNYQVDIITNPRRDEFDFEFLGVVTRPEFVKETVWHIGDVKLALDEDASGSYSGLYYLGDKSSREAECSIHNRKMILRLEPLNDSDRTIVFFTKRSRQYRGSRRDSGGQEVTASGTGFFITDTGDLLTAFHLVEGAGKIEVTTSDGLTVPASLISFSKEHDLALLNTGTASHGIPIKSASELSLGDDVFTMGFPASQILGEQVKYSDGTISSLSGPGDEQSLMQINVPIQPGNSGGPLVAQDGFAVGVVTSTAAVLPFVKAIGTLPQNVNWAVKVDYCMSLIGDLHQSEAVDQSRLIDQVKRSVCKITVYH